MLKGATKSNGQKDKLDRFYTSADEACRIVASLPAIIPLLDKNSDIVPDFYEPSAGDGAFVRAVEIEYDDKPVDIHAYDIAPSSTPLCYTKIDEQDFLTANIAYSNNRIVIGNPPFGEQGKLCFEFVEKALEIAPYVCFILPPSFKKESYQRRLGLSPIAVIELNDTQYRVGDIKIDVPSSFFVFDKHNKFVEEKIDFDKLPFVFLSKSDADKADFTIRRVGGTSGTANKRTDVSKQSNYFCMTRNGRDTGDVIDMINEIDFPEKDWSVGPRSLSQREIAKRILNSMESECTAF